MTCKYVTLSLFYVTLAFLAGCKHNIAHIDGTVNFPSEYTIDAPFEQTWSAAVEAVMDTTTIATMDSRTGYISSDIAVVDGQELSVIDQALFGQTYRFAYNIRIQPEGATQSKVTAKVRLVVEQFMGMLKRESRTETVENYLQAKLHTSLCGKIFQDNRDNCISGATSQARQVTSPHPPAPLPAKTSGGVRQVSDPRVETSQKVLGNLGYSPGPVDGLMGKKTKQALMSFQQDNGLVVTGDLDDETFALLQSGEAPQHEANTKKLALSESGSHNQSDQTDQGFISLPDNFDTTVDPQDENQQTNNNASTPDETKPTPTTFRSPIFKTDESAAFLEEADLFGANILDTIPEGTVLNILDIQGEYYKVRYQGRDGFVIKAAATEHY